MLNNPLILLLGSLLVTPIAGQSIEDLSYVQQKLLLS